MSKETKSSAPNANASKAVNVPAKYRRLGSVSNAPWFNLEPGNSFEGKLLGVYERVNERANQPNQPKMVKFYQVQLSTPCAVKVGKGEEASIQTAEVGTVINLNHAKKVEDLLPCALEIKHGAEYNVFVACGKKHALKNGNTMWDMTTGVEQVKAPLATSDDEPDFADESED
jgi:hypothetical protein